MNNSLAILPASNTTLALVPPPAPAPPPPPPNTPVKGRSFMSVYEEVMQRADDMLSDRVVHVADLRMNNAGNLVLPGGAEYRVNDWARKQLASMLGLRWQKWFESASPEERAEEVNRRFSRIPGEKKIRAWRSHDNDTDGIARAVLESSFTPIDDARVFSNMGRMMKGLLDEYRFTSTQFTESTTHYSAVHAEAFDLDGDHLHAGWHLRNSEVGASALSLDDYWLRLVCTNGLMVRVGVGGNAKRAFYRTHRAIDDDQLAASLVISVGRLPERWQTAFAWMQSAKRITVPHPDDAIAAILSDSAEVPKALVEEAQRVVLRDGDLTRFGVVQAITLVAHSHPASDADTKFHMERLAGDYLAATPAEAA